MTMKYVPRNQDGPAGTAAAFGQRAAYDSPGFVDQLPGYGRFDRPDTTPGSDGVNPGATAGAVVGTPIVSVPGASSQVPESMPHVAVTAGDTSSFSDDLPIHDGSYLLPGGAVGNAPDRTGAGEGHANHMKHPNNPNANTGSI